MRMNCPELSTVHVKGFKWKVLIQGQLVTKSIKTKIYNEKWMKIGQEY